ncbi:MAG: hypothetical protein HW421_3193 [Ignavibacteria bacterium]|nr:hypothetical protein [Ignavibacteria bacterium]
MLHCLKNKIDGLRGNVLLISLNDNEKIPKYFWIIEQPDGCFALFEDFGPLGRELLDEDTDIDDLISRHPENNIIISY